MASEDDDLKLTAYLDGELDPDDRAAIEARLAAESDLQARLEALRDAAQLTRAAFETLLDAAPAAAMQARLDATRVAPQRPVAPFPRRAAAVAAAVAIVAFAAGLGAGRWSAGPGGAVARRDDWRAAVVEYMDLYTTESFGEATSPRLGAELATLSQRLDAPLDAARLQIDGLALRRAELLQYDGAPLGQIGYLDGATPVAFCILRDGEADAPLSTDSRNGFAAASWAGGGRGFMLVGKVPAERLEGLARLLKQRMG